MKNVLLSVLGVLLGLFVATSAVAQKQYNSSQEEFEAVQKAAVMEKEQNTPQLIVKGIKTNAKHADLSGSFMQKSTMPAKTPSKTAVFSQDFEGITTTDITNLGWTVIPTPEHPEDIWSTGYVQSGGVNIPGHSGQYYAILGFQSYVHDTWTFTSGIALEADQTYKISFWTIMANYATSFEKMDVSIGTEATVAGMTTEIYNSDNGSDSEWRQVTYNYTPTTAGTYYIGFHGYSQDANFILLDDVIVEPSVPGPTFEGAATIAFGNVHDIIPVKQTTYNIKNTGTEDLTLSLTSNSPELTIDGLPPTLAAGESADVTVTLDKNTAGNYEGNFVLETNDEANTTVTVTVTANIIAALVTGYYYAPFETGMPSGWTNGGFSLSASAGIDSTNAVRANAWGSSQIGFITNYIQMGEDPSISFQYKAIDFAYIGTGDPTPGDKVILAVFVSEDYGETWNQVLYKAPGDNEHAQSADYVLENISLPQYAGKTVMVQLASAQTGGGDFFLYIDDMRIGTEPENELKALSVTGTNTPTAGVASTYTVTIENAGLNAQTEYDVKLMQEGNTEIAVMEGVSINPGETKEFDFEWTPATEGGTYIYGEVVFENDTDASNNKTPNLNISVLSSSSVAVNIGDGVLKQSVPVEFYYNNSASQSLYYANEIGLNAGSINSLAFKASFNTEYTSPMTVGVWIGETDKQVFANNTDWVSVDELTQIHNAILTMPAGDNDWMITFPEPYQYEGGNLVIYAVKLGANYVSGKQFYNTAYEGTVRTMNKYTDTQGAITVENPGQASVLMQSAPNITFFIDAGDVGSVSGVVTNTESEPLEGVKVELVGTQLYAMTNAEGEYSFATISADTHTLRASLALYSSEEVDITVTAENNTDQNITMELLPKYDISGFVVSSDNGDNIAGAVVSFVGEFENYEATTGETGEYLIEDIVGGEYEITVSAQWFTSETITYTVSSSEVLDFELDETPLPVKGLSAAMINDVPELEWNNPRYVATGTPKDWIIDDGSYETGWAVNAGFDVSYGGKFITEDEGIISSVDVLGITNAAYTGKTLTVDVYNENQQLVASSEPFTVESAAWVNVELNDEAPFTGTFYAMVHWGPEAGNAGYLGFDTNGPNIDQNLQMRYSPGEGWSVFLPPSGSQAGVFMVRAHGIVTGEAKTYTNGAEPVIANNIEAQQAINLELPAAGQAGTKTILSPAVPKVVQDYTVYRFLAENKENEEAWTTVETISDTTYTDNDWESLEQGLYQYAVKANYTDAQSPARFTAELPKGMTVPYTISVSTATSDPVIGAEVSLVCNDGNTDHAYSATITTGSSVTFPEVWIGTYSLTVALEGFAVVTEEINIDAEGTYNVELAEFAAPVGKITATANAEETSAEVIWYAPGHNPPSTPKAYILDDGEAESGYQMNPNANASLGNIVTNTDAGIIQSVDIWGFINNASTGRQVTVEIMNAAGQVLGSSAPVGVPTDWLNVPLTTDASFSGTFYAMVRWPAAAGASNYLGLSTNDADLGYYWTPAAGLVAGAQAGVNAGTFLIRVNALVEGKAKSYGFKPQALLSDDNNRRTIDLNIPANRFDLTTPIVAGNPKSVSNSAPKAMENYSIYRLVKGEEADTSAWTTITENTTDTTYTDNTFASLTQGLYVYAVVANYTNDNTSAPKFSNDVAKGMTAETYTVNVTNNAGDPVVGAEIILTGNDGEHEYTMTIENGSAAVFNGVWKGTYSISVTLAGFETYTADNIEITETGQSYTANLEEITYTPSDLEVVFDGASGADFTWEAGPEVGKALITVTVGNLWGDGSGYQLLMDNTATQYGVTIPTSNPLTSDCSPAATLYDVFTDKIPANADPVCTTTNIMLNDTYTLEVAAGTYDFCFANPTPGQLIWIASTSATSYGRADDFVFEAGKQYAFVISMVGQNDNVALTVTDAKKGAPKSAEFVVYLDEEEQGTTSTPFYNFPNVSEGTHTAGVKAIFSSGYESPVATVDFTMPTPEFTVTFEVKSGSEPVRATIKVAGYGAGSTANTQGILVYPLTIPNGTHTATVTASGYNTVNQEFTVDGEDLTVKVEMLPLGIDENGAGVFTLYPNPANSKLTVAKSSTNLATVEIFNASGAVMHTFEMTSEKQDIDVSSFGAGVYMIRMIENETTSIQRFIKN